MEQFAGQILALDHDLPQPGAGVVVAVGGEVVGEAVAGQVVLQFLEQQVGRHAVPGRPGDLLLRPNVALP